MKFKKFFYFLVHLNFIAGLLYALYFFITTPRSNMPVRRLWAYENWIIFSFYAIFIFLTLNEKEVRLNTQKKIQGFVSHARNMMLTNLVLLIFPWGLFLIFGPPDLLEMFSLGSIWWKLVGAASLVGAGMYYLPFRFYKHPLSYPIFVIGSISNTVSGLVLSWLFVVNQAGLVVWSCVPLLFYFAYFFYEQAREYHQVEKQIEEIGDI
ncbi:MAG TPA: hypothetical protein ENN77_00375 [Candidatus Wirthbacteria bacterium]|nr:hypothetical protein [Candidatus Wirthbacteria bacterium]